ncbi:16S rRNA (uracil(1498)-N(3))-methyltransferase [Leptospira wolffii]|uniref:16S rRNA (uracil(1498)-N(3))-methyltransferase n=1 Tax=Leptospira wolffii TaxID=409998 RepID=UPI0010836265|nr:RsmE family RNA methyltransferase [Leptospira wolffii]TGK60038.1 16S rRNA (uracil(1498)-N(3))-methyltransferase [Leptospira wolffii]TGK72382.1 16S rRNA (uracil(1498)-N(3))-methyltransferase [Leptospira wolffii]TGK76045.1 16S rRNA (uracil(1498)-N(3))-methyltransferase [Leptospira wolffii]TGL30297.1 16S rRNA (uracil(1498)-N(3))-methyltransferase [Leptospira wolffii]
MSDEEIVFFREDASYSPNLKLEGEEISHLKALRSFGEDKIVAIKDGRGNSFYYKVPASSKNGELIRTEKKERSTNEAKLATAIPKGNRLEWLIQKGTELGITKFSFLVFAHSDRKDLNPERLWKVAAEACAQSKQDFVPEIEGPFRIEEFLQKAKASPEKLILLDPRANESLGADTISGKTVIVGPEGGFRREEIAEIEAASEGRFRIGESILRIETACLYAASLFRLGSIR